MAIQTMEWVNNSTNRWINKRGRTVWWLSSRRGRGWRSAGVGGTYGRGRAAFSRWTCTVCTILNLGTGTGICCRPPSASPPYIHKHLLPCTHRKKGGWGGVRGHTRSTWQVCIFAIPPGPRSPGSLHKNLNASCQAIRRWYDQLTGPH